MSKSSLLNILYRNIIKSLHTPPHQSLMLHKHSNCEYISGLENSYNVHEIFITEEPSTSTLLSLGLSFIMTC